MDFYGCDGCIFSETSHSPPHLFLKKRTSAYTQLPSSVSPQSIWKATDKSCQPWRPDSGPEQTQADWLCCPPTPANYQEERQWICQVTASLEWIRFQTANALYFVRSPGLAVHALRLVLCSSTVSQDIIVHGPENIWQQKWILDLDEQESWDIMREFSFSDSTIPCIRVTVRPWVLHYVADRTLHSQNKAEVSRAESAGLGW